LKDLDTLLPNYLISKIKNKPIVYDSHEYFTGVPELTGRPIIQKLWKSIEKWIFPKLKNVYTVNESIADLYKKEYGVDVKVIKNVSIFRKEINKKPRKNIGLPEDKKIIVLQGSGINIQRGAEEAVEAMQFIDDAIFLIIGSGDVIDILKKMVLIFKLEKKIMFLPKMPIDKLFEYTVHADIGLTLDKETNINYRFSLPNKLFDYIQARVPILSSPLIEIKKVIEKYDIGMLIENHDPAHISEKIKSMLADENRIKIWKENLNFAASVLCWENEEKKLIEIFEEYAG